MTLILAILFVIGTYLVGSIPFGYLIARWKGVDLFQAGSGNIGATNVGRVLGRKLGFLVFALDFAKGAIPVALAALCPLDVRTAFGSEDAFRVATALAAFLGHLFPIALRFRGGKGVATGAGAVLVLMPFPTLIAMLIWLATVATYRMISLGSIFAVLALSTARLLSVKLPFDGDAIILTAFTLGGTALVILKHRGNIRRMVQGTENRLDPSSWEAVARAMHVLAAGTWFGSAVFFNFLAAPAIFQSFAEVVNSAPNDRTAYQPLNPGSTEEEKKILGSSLAGAAVGPLFPRFFALNGLCAAGLLITCRRCSLSGGAIQRWRQVLILLATLSVIIAWPISLKVSSLRLERFAMDPETAQMAKAAFGPWHAVRLLLSFITTLLVGGILVLAGWLPSSSSEKRV